jgi:hypothetical protein
METNSQDSKPDFIKISVNHFNRVGNHPDQSVRALEVFAYKKGYEDCWCSLQSELSSLKEERDLLKAENEKLKAALAAAIITS